jgi:hypothetical protein
MELRFVIGQNSLDSNLKRELGDFRVSLARTVHWPASHKMCAETSARVGKSPTFQQEFVVDYWMRCCVVLECQLLIMQCSRPASGNLPQKVLVDVCVVWRQKIRSYRNDSVFDKPLYDAPDVDDRERNG